MTFARNVKYSAFALHELLSFWWSAVTQISYNIRLDYIDIQYL